MSIQDFAPATAMKSVFIAYNQAYHEIILRLLSRLSLRGYTAWEQVQGKGSERGEPHIGSHAWPTLNSAMLVMTPQARVAELLTELRALDEATPDQGLRAFVWSVEAMI